MIVLGTVLLVLVLVIGWVLTAIGMPGNWLMVAAVALYVYLVPAEAATAIGWGVVVALAVLAVLGEILEFAAGAVGVKQVGGSRRGAVTALLGSVIGGVFGLFVGLPVPVVGSILAAILFAGVGAMIGAILGERSTGRSLRESLFVGKAAFWGRVWGTVGKILIGTAMLVVALGALFI